MVRYGIYRGLITTVFLIAYFVLMRLLGFADNTWLRALNAVILFGGIYLGIKKWKTKREGEMPYFNGLAVGMLIATSAAVLFSVFLVAYLSWDTAFMKEIANIPIFRLEFTPGKAALVIFFEAMFSGYIFSYASMQFLKPSIEIENKYPS